MNGMKRLRAFLFCLAFALRAIPVRAQSPGSPPATGQPNSSATPLSLEDLEDMALQHSPALAQAAARIRASQGRKLQAGLYPNPVVGYDGEEISSGPIIRGGEHGFFVQQEIPTAGKLRLNKSIVAEEERQADASARIEKRRVLNSVELLYYQALSAQRLVALRGQLARIAQDASDVAHDLSNVGQADQPDVLEAEVEAERAEVDLQAAENDRERVWRELAAAVGVPSLPPTPLAGSLDEPLPKLNFEDSLHRILRESPEIQLAEREVRTAEQTLKRQRAQRIPNLLVRGGLRDNRELLEANGTSVGLEGFAEVGVQIPIFDRNQGNIAAAKAEIESAQFGVERGKLSLRARLARAYRDYRDSLGLVEEYRDRIIPRAQRAYELYLTSYKQMAAAYPQVIIAQRNLAELQVQYVRSLETLWKTAVEIRGMLLVAEPGSSIMSPAN